MSRQSSKPKDAPVENVGETSVAPLLDIDADKSIRDEQLEMSAMQSEKRDDHAEEEEAMQIKDGGLSPDQNSQL